MAFPEVEDPFIEGLFQRVVDIVIPQAKPAPSPGLYSVRVTWNVTYDDTPHVPPGVGGYLEIPLPPAPCLVTLNDASNGNILDRGTVTFQRKIVTWNGGPVFFVGNCKGSLTLQGNKIGAASLIIHTPGGMNGGTTGSDNNVSGTATFNNKTASGFAIDTDAPAPGKPGDPNNFIAGLLPGTPSVVTFNPDFVVGKLFFGGFFL